MEQLIQKKVPQAKLCKLYKKMTDAKSKEVGVWMAEESAIQTVGNTQPSGYV